MLYRILTTAVIVIVLGVGIAAAQEPLDQFYTGVLDADTPSVTYTFTLSSGQSVLITAEASSGDLDPSIRLQGPDGTLLAENDDRSSASLDSALGYTATSSGEYTVTLQRYEGRANSGGYRLSISVGGDDVLEPLQDLMMLELSGPQLVIDTEHFRIHYTLSGEDATTEEFAQEVAKAMEAVWQIEIEQMGWPAPLTDGTMGGDDRLDIYLTSMLSDFGEGALGMARRGSGYGDNPHSPAVERFATSALLRLDNDFDGLEDLNATPVSIMRSTAAHEFHHAIQFGFDSNEPHRWYYEASAAWMETVTFPKEQDAVRYMAYNFSYPERCFGTSGDSQLMYGEWMFLQSLVDVHGRNVVLKLWDNIAQLDGFEALERTLDEYGDSMTAALARYRVQNIVRDYKFATYLDDETVWLEADITSIGRTPGGRVQELGANVFAFELSGTYAATLVNDEDALELWAVGVHGQEADSFQLGRGGVFNSADYDHFYLMVFNPTYDESVNDCTYYDYDLEINLSDGTPAAAFQTWNARYFAPLR